MFDRLKTFARAVSGIAVQIVKSAPRPSWVREAEEEGDLDGPLYTTEEAEKIRDLIEVPRSGLLTSIRKGIARVLQRFEKIIDPLHEDPQVRDLIYEEDNLDAIEESRGKYGLEPYKTPKGKKTDPTFQREEVDGPGAQEAQDLTGGELDEETALRIDKDPMGNLIIYDWETLHAVVDKMDPSQLVMVRAYVNTTMLDGSKYNQWISLTYCVTADFLQLDEFLSSRWNEIVRRYHVRDATVLQFVVEVA